MPVSMDSNTNGNGASDHAGPSTSAIKPPTPGRTDISSGNSHGPQRRKFMRACDVCRRKKIRCDGRQVPGSRCTHCIETKKECTYIEQAQKRPPPPGYVEDLERRYSKAQRLLTRLMPSSELKRELERMDVDPLANSNSPERIAHRLADSLTHVFDSDGSTSPQGGGDVAEESAYGSNHSVLLPDRFSLLHVSNGRMYGKSSGAALVQTALDLKTESHDPPVGGLHSEDVMLQEEPEEKKPYVWVTHAWEQVTIPEKPRPGFTFPPEDLLETLVQVYFDHVHLITPLLHRPTVRKGVAARTYLTDDTFGAVILAVCAVSARLCNDPRVVDSEAGKVSAGFQWFNQVQSVQRSPLSPPGLHDLQIYCLSAQYLAGISAPQAAWTVLGTGLRVAQDVGAHRRNTYASPLTHEKELLRRAWWVMMYLDRSLSSSLGRSCAVQDEDFDLGLPVECDDEYWDHPDPQQAWKQPPGKPSRLAFFISALKLNHILATALRTIYSINKSKMVLGFVGDEWEKHIVSELDSALNKWIDTIPEHLRWNPDCQDVHVFRQSVTLYGNYYLNQILIHRPFISSPRKNSTLSFPSLAICANAARSCSHIVDPRDPRCPDAMINLQMPVFTAAVVLLLNIWGGKKHGLTSDPLKEMQDVFKCMEMLKICEKSFLFAGRLRNIIYELASVGSLPLPPSPDSASTRVLTEAAPRVLHTEQTKAEAAPVTTKMLYPNAVEYERRPRASSSSSYNPAQAYIQKGPENMTSQSHLTHMHNQFTTLPLYTNDLARMPLFGRFESQTLPPPSSSGWDRPRNPHPNPHIHSHAHPQNEPYRGLPPPIPPISSQVDVYPVHPNESVPAAPQALDGFQPSIPSYCSDDGSASASSFGELSPISPAAHFAGQSPMNMVEPYTTEQLEHLRRHPQSQQQARQSPPVGSISYSPTGYSQFQQGYGGGGTMMMDQDTMDVWSHTPSSYELADWGAYLSTFRDLQTPNGGRPQ